MAKPTRIQSRLLLACVSLGLLGLAGCRDKTDEDIIQVAELVKARDYNGLAALLDDPDEALRCRAAKALAWVRADEAVPHYVTLLGYQKCGFEVRAEAANRIIELEAWELGWAPLVALLGDPQREIRWNAAKVLGLSGRKESIKPLKTCRKDDDPFVAAWCKWGLCRANGGAKDDCREPNMDLSRGRSGP